VFGQVAVRAKRYKVRECIIPLLAPLDFVVHLQVLQRPALLTSPSVPLQHPLHQPPINLLPELDPLDLPQHLVAVSDSSSRP